MPEIYFVINFYYKNKIEAKLKRTQNGTKAEWGCKAVKQVELHLVIFNKWAKSRGCQKEVCLGSSNN